MKTIIDIKKASNGFIATSKNGGAVIAKTLTELLELINKDLANAIAHHPDLDNTGQASLIIELK